MRYFAALNERSSGMGTQETLTPSPSQRKRAGRGVCEKDIIKYVTDQTITAIEI